MKMNQYAKRMIATLCLTAVTTGMAAPVWAGTDSTADLKPMPINAPVLISAAEGWQGHWAEKDLQALRTRVNLPPEMLLSDAGDPDAAMPIRFVADVLTYLFGAGGEPGDALDRAVKRGLIRPADFAGEQIRPDQPVSRELFALLLTRALGVNGAEAPVTAEPAPRFVDASDIQTTYRAAVALMQAEGLLVGDGEGRFSPTQPVTYAQVARTMVKVSAWTVAQTAKVAALNPAEATYLIDGRKVTLADGLAEQPVAPGSAAKTVTKLSDRLAAGDLNSDGQVDIAAVLTQDGGGSGTFYYLAVLQHDGTPVAAVFLGDRIAVQNVRIVDGKVTVALLTRGAAEPMAARPSIMETRTFAVKDGALVALGS
jgi:hypothetical protein